MSEYLPAISEARAVMGQLERMVRDPSIQVEKIESLYRMMKEERHYDEVRAFNQAMRQCQQEMEPVVRDEENTHTNSKYAKLEKIDWIMRPIYTSHGFAVRYGSEACPRPDWVRITCTVSHDAGHSETHYLDAPPDGSGSQGKQNKTGVQAVGSVVTYLRRYLLCMVFNIVLANDPFDTDGEPSHGQQKAQAARTTYDRPRTTQQKGWQHPLDEPDPVKWMANLRALRDACKSKGEVTKLAGELSVKKALETAPDDIKSEINQCLADGYARFDNTVTEGDAGEDQITTKIQEIVEKFQDTDSLKAHNRLFTDKKTNESIEWLKQNWAKRYETELRPYIVASFERNKPKPVAEASTEPPADMFEEALQMASEP